MGRSNRLAGFDQWRLLTFTIDWDTNLDAEMG